MKKVFINNEILRRYRLRPDFYDIPDREFKNRFRFSKENVTRITNLVRGDLEKESDRGSPFSPEQIVCLSLDILGGGHFQRMEGVASGCTKSTVNLLLYK